MLKRGNGAAELIYC